MSGTSVGTGGAGSGRSSSAMRERSIHCAIGLRRRERTLQLGVVDDAALLVSTSSILPAAGATW
jgi:hypothetical protein